VAFHFSNTATQGRNMLAKKQQDQSFKLITTVLNIGQKEQFFGQSSG